MSDELEPLKPLSAEENAIFEARRETAAVVQHKCANCGAWYETAKRNAPFQETFNCDCGNRMQFDVPALDTGKALSNEDILGVLGDPDQRLDSGMKAAEAIKRAAAWWERKGRKLMIAEGKRQQQPHGVDNGMGAAFASRDPDDDRFLNSGIIHGDAWDQLDRRSRLMVIKVWHHFNVRVPDVLDADPETPHLIQNRGKIN